MTATTPVWAVDKLARRHKVVIASVVHTSGSVPGKVGARFAIADSVDGFHEPGGAGLELRVIGL